MKIYVDVIVQISYSTLHILHPTANKKHITSLLGWYRILLWTLYMMYNLLYNNAIYSWFRNPPRRRRRRHSHNKSKIHFHNMYIRYYIILWWNPSHSLALHFTHSKWSILFLYFYELQSTAPALLNQQPLWHAGNEGECWMHDYGVQQWKRWWWEVQGGWLDGNKTIYSLHSTLLKHENEFYIRCLLFYDAPST